MSVSKSRLGRGLQSLIAGGLSSPKPASAPAPSRPAAARQAKPAPGAKGKPAAPVKPAAAPTKPAAAATPKVSSPAKSAPAAKTVAPAKPAPVAAAKPAAGAPAKPAAPAAVEPAPAPVKASVAAPVADPAPASGPGLREIPLADLVPNPYQPRREFDADSLAELAESIRSEGLLQPIVVRRHGDKYQLVAGERRWRACQLLKLRVIPARIVEASDSSSAVIAMIENLQRENLNPIEEALGYASLLRDFDLTQEAVAERVGKARASVANALRLLSLPREIQSLIQRGQLSVGHAKVLLGVEDDAQRAILARRVVENGLSVRQTEALVKTLRTGSGGPAAPRPVAALESEAVRDLERRLASHLNTRVKLHHAAKRGRLVIEYYGNDDLQRILETLGVSG